MKKQSSEQLLSWDIPNHNFPNDTYFENNYVTTFVSPTDAEYINIGLYPTEAAVTEPDGYNGTVTINSITLASTVPL